MSAWPAPLRFYTLATWLAEPLAPWLLERRARRGKEDSARLEERLGRASEPRPAGRLVWFHAVSVGEGLSQLPIIERLAQRREDLTILVTSATRTSAELLADRLPPRAIHQYAPIDGPRAVHRFLEHWRPDVGVFAESELWPNLLRSTKAQGTALALLGARISATSTRSWDRVPKSARAVLRLFDLIWAQDGRARDWIEGHGVAVEGQFDLKRLGEPLPWNQAELEALEAAVAGRQVLVAASTHPGEEMVIAEAVMQLRPRPLLIIVPRHPERGAEVAADLAAAGWRTAQRSLGDAPESGAEAYIADTLGELGLFYRLADAAFVGGSLFEDLAGHNPLEAVRLGKPVVTGPHVESFAEIYAELLAAKAALMVKDPVELVQALRALMAEPALARALGRRAQAAVEDGGEGFARLWASLQTLLPAP